MMAGGGDGGMGVVNGAIMAGVVSPSVAAAAAGMSMEAAHNMSSDPEFSRYAEAADLDIFGSNYAVWRLTFADSETGTPAAPPEGRWAAVGDKPIEPERPFRLEANDYGFAVFNVAADALCSLPWRDCNWIHPADMAARQKLAEVVKERRCTYYVFQGRYFRKECKLVEEDDPEAAGRGSFSAFHVLAGGSRGKPGSFSASGASFDASAPTGGGGGGGSGATAAGTPPKRRWRQEVNYEMFSATEHVYLSYWPTGSIKCITSAFQDIVKTSVLRRDEFTMLEADSWYRDRAAAASGGGAGGGGGGGSGAVRSAVAAFPTQDLMRAARTMRQANDMSAYQAIMDLLSRPALSRTTAHSRGDSFNETMPVPVPGMHRGSSFAASGGGGGLPVGVPAGGLVGGISSGGESMVDPPGAGGAGGAHGVHGTRRGSNASFGSSGFAIGYGGDADHSMGAASGDPRYAAAYMAGMPYAPPHPGTAGAAAHAAAMYPGGAPGLGWQAGWAANIAAMSAHAAAASGMPSAMPMMRTPSEQALAAATAASRGGGGGGVVALAPAGAASAPPSWYGGATSGGSEGAVGFGGRMSGDFSSGAMFDATAAALSAAAAAGGPGSIAAGGGGMRHSLDNATLPADSLTLEGRMPSVHVAGVAPLRSDLMPAAAAYGGLPAGAAITVSPPSAAGAAVAAAHAPGSAATASAAAAAAAAAEAQNRSISSSSMGLNLGSPVVPGGGVSGRLPR